MILVPPPLHIKLGVIGKIVQAFDLVVRQIRRKHDIKEDVRVISMICYIPLSQKLVRIVKTTIPVCISACHILI